MYELCDKVKTLKPYEPNRDVCPVKLDANESRLPLPFTVAAALRQAAGRAALNLYPDPTAAKLCAAAGRFYGVPEAQVVAGNGSDELISVITSCLLQKGDTVAVFEPDFSMYAFYASLCELKTVALRKDPDELFDPAAAAAEIKAAGAAMLIFSNPCNPTSLGIDREGVKTLIEQSGALTVVDEAYMDFWDQSVASLIDEYDNLIVLRTCSKALGAAGIRLGFALCRESLAQTLRAVKSPYNVNAMTQGVGTRLLRERALLEARAKKMAQAARKLCDGLDELAFLTSDIIKVYRPCTNFVYLRLNRDREVFEQLRARGILVRHFEGHLRITAGTERDNAAVLGALREILK